MWAPILNNLVVIATAGVFIAGLRRRRCVEPAQMTAGQILLLGGGTLLGIVVQAAGLLPALRKVGFRWKWRFDFRELGLRELGRLGAWMLLLRRGQPDRPRRGVQPAQPAPRGEDAAGLLIYNNVFLMLMMAHGIIAVSIITALMPRMSAAAADGRFADVTAELSRGTRTGRRRCSRRSRSATRCSATPIAVTLFQVRRVHRRERAGHRRWCCSPPRWPWCRSRSASSSPSPSTRCRTPGRRR